MFTILVALEVAYSEFGIITGTGPSYGVQSHDILLFHSAIFRRV